MTNSTIKQPTTYSQMLDYLLPTKQVNGSIYVRGRTGRWRRERELRVVSLR